MYVPVSLALKRQIFFSTFHMRFIQILNVHKTANAFMIFCERCKRITSMHDIADPMNMPRNVGLSAMC